jgi:polysaccharide deacetylase 2 family uncharacterized protein YibQ
MAQSARSPRKALIAFWGAVVAVFAIGAGVLQYLGPPKPPPLPMAAIVHGAAVLPVAAAPVPPKQGAAKPAIAMQAAFKPAVPSPAATLPSMSAMGTGSVLPVGMPIPPPNPVLLGPAVSNPNWQVPKIGPNGQAPMQAYAATVPAGAGPRVAILVAGMGDDDAQSQEALTMLPAPVSLGITPYGAHSADVAGLARASGHETILEIPMQARDPATENAGNEALVMAGPITVDQPMLDWSLAKVQGYAGVTDAIGASQGAGFMDNPNAKSWLLQEIADKGLFFIDARQTGTTAYAWNRTADVVIDPIGAPEQESAQLASLTAIAKAQGSALGILMIPTPNAVQMVQSWAQSLRAEGVTLVPVSALVLPPTAQAVTAAASP